MTLAELDPTFLKILDEKTYQMMDKIQEADGVQFLCPVCYDTNKGKVGTHSIICWKPTLPLKGQPGGHDPGPGRWEMKGTGYHDLSLVAGSSSVFLTTAECKAHFFVENGRIKLAMG